MLKTTLTNYPGYFQKYIDLVPDEDNLLTVFFIQTKLIKDFLETITEEKSNHSYAPGKWTIKEMLQHIIDTERIFSFRALCFARGEKASLPGFDESEYAANVDAGKRSWQSLKEEFIMVRQSSEYLFKSFGEEDLEKTGIANNNITSVLSMGLITLGHVYHHKNILVERYL